MKKIEINDDMYNSLIELSKEMLSQDNRATAMPHMFQIQTDERKYVPDGCGEEIWVCDDTTLEDEKEEADAIAEFKDWDNTDKYYELQDWEIEEILINAGYRKVSFVTENSYQNTFFTAKACDNHIKQNSYHYNNPVCFLNHAFRNTEMELISKFLCELTGGKIHK